jgi:phenylalanyl-tRNA synthetase alpha chain
MEMGFEEMPTNKWVESSFWNFDALFQPQSHPARDAHDTFFMKTPASANAVPMPYYDTVKTTHEEGGFGSIGYGCNFKKEEAMKNLLRTHTTAISAQMLYRLANQPGGFTPKKYFSIDRVFRNEAMDATHLCEFHQVEGFVADRNLTLGNLIGIIRTFFDFVRYSSFVKVFFSGFYLSSYILLLINYIIKVKVKNKIKYYRKEILILVIKLLINQTGLFKNYQVIQ